MCSLHTILHGFDHQLFVISNTKPLRGHDYVILEYDVRGQTHQLPKIIEWRGCMNPKGLAFVPATISRMDCGFNLAYKIDASLRSRHNTLVLAESGPWN